LGKRAECQQFAKHWIEQTLFKLEGNTTMHRTLFLKSFSRIICLGTAILMAQSNEALAEENRAERAGFFYMGLDHYDLGTGGATTGLGTGFTLPLNGSFARDDWLLSGNFGISEDQTGSSYYASVALGYLWNFDGSYLSFGAGASTRKNKDVGGLIQYGFETTKPNSIYFQTYGSWSSIDNAVYAHGKLGYRSTQKPYGLEITYSDDSISAPLVRIGGFLGGIQVNEKVSLNLAAGYEYRDSAIKVDGFYTTLSLSIPFSY
jgi:hypothetical protein